MYISQVSGERLQDHWSSGLFFIFITLYFVVINENLFHAYHAYHPYIYMLNDSFNKVTMMRQFHKKIFFFQKDVLFADAR